MQISKKYDLVNVPSDPLFVSVVNQDGAPLQPIQFQGQLRIASGTLANGVTEFYKVPKGKRLVIEHVSARADNLAADDTLDLTVSTTVNGAMVQHFLGLVGPPGRPKIDGNAQASQILCQQVRFYADPKTNVSVGGSRVTRANDAFVVIVMSGYFLDVS